MDKSLQFPEPSITNRIYESISNSKKANIVSPSMIPRPQVSSNKTPNRERSSEGSKTTLPSSNFPMRLLSQRNSYSDLGFLKKKLEFEVKEEIIIESSMKPPVYKTPMKVVGVMSTPPLMPLPHPSSWRNRNERKGNAVSFVSTNYMSNPNNPSLIPSRSKASLKLDRLVHGQAVSGWMSHWKGSFKEASTNEEEEFEKVMSET